MPEMIVAERLEKRYGPRWAVRGVSFWVDEGEVVGLLGPNGSGKSTILRILTGYLLPSGGTASVAGLDIVEDALAARRRLGYVPEDAPLYDGMRTLEFLSFMARIKGLSGAAAGAACGATCERLGLEPVVGTPIGKLSRGYRQRVAIAQALLNDPEVLILDEPTNSLDAYQVIGIRELVRSLAGRRTVLVASHVLSEIEKVASRIMILAEGRLLSADAMREAAGARRFRLKAAGDVSTVLAILRAAPGVGSAEAEGHPGEPQAYLVEGAPGPRIAEGIVRALVQQGFAVSELVEVKPDLEHVFLDLTRRAAMAA